MDAGQEPGRYPFIHPFPHLPSHPVRLMVGQNSLTASRWAYNQLYFGPNWCSCFILVLWEWSGEENGISQDWSKKPTRKLKASQTFPRCFRSTAFFHLSPDKLLRLFTASSFTMRILEKGRKNPKEEAGRKLTPPLEPTSSSWSRFKPISSNLLASPSLYRSTNWQETQTQIVAWNPSSFIPSQHFFSPITKIHLRTKNLGGEEEKGWNPFGT